MLQYVESFYKVKKIVSSKFDQKHKSCFYSHQEPIRDWRIPIKGLQNWFEHITVTKKREDISNLLIEKIREYDPKNLPLPKLDFPTKDGENSTAYISRECVF